MLFRGNIIIFCCSDYQYPQFKHYWRGNIIPGRNNIAHPIPYAKLQFSQWSKVSDHYTAHTKISNASLHPTHEYYLSSSTISKKCNLATSATFTSWTDWMRSFFYNSISFFILFSKKTPLTNSATSTLHGKKNSTSNKFFKNSWYILPHNSKSANSECMNSKKYPKQRKDQKRIIKKNVCCPSI